MRLIDADKLKDIIDDTWILDRIDEQPTIDAVPVEWIKKQLKEEKYRTFLVDYIEWGDCLRWLIDEWEEENETD